MAGVGWARLYEKDGAASSISFIFLTSYQNRFSRLISISGKAESYLFYVTCQTKGQNLNPLFYLILPVKLQTHIQFGAIESLSAMDFWPEFMATSWGREFVAGGFGGVAGIISGYPLDTLRIRQQQSSKSGSAFTILRRMLAVEGPTSLYRGMAAPLASVSFQVLLLLIDNHGYVSGSGSLIRIFLPLHRQINKQLWWSC